MCECVAIKLMCNNCTKCVTTGGTCVTTGGTCAPPLYVHIGTHRRQVRLRLEVPLHI